MRARRRGLHGAKIAQESPETAQDKPKVDPRAPGDGSKETPGRIGVAPRWSHDGTKGGLERPKMIHARSAQEEDKPVQGGQGEGQRGAKVAEDGSKVGPRRAQGGPWRRQDGPSWPQDGLKMAPRWPPGNPEEPQDDPRGGPDNARCAKRVGVEGKTAQLRQFETTLRKSLSLQGPAHTEKPRNNSKTVSRAPQDGPECPR